MASYTKISGMTAASALDGTEQFAGVQSSAPVKVTAAQVATYAAGASALTSAFQPLAAGASSSTQVTGEYIFDDGSWLDYSGSVSDGAQDAAVTLTELPSTTKAIWVYWLASDTGTSCRIRCQPATASTQVISLGATFADAGTNTAAGTAWLPTNGNSIYFGTNACDTTINFFIMGYKIGA